MTRENLRRLLWVATFIAIGATIHLANSESANIALVSIVSALSGVLLTNALSLHNRMEEERQVRTNLASAILNELLFRAKPIVDAHDFLASFDGLWVKETLEVLLLDEPVILLELLKRLDVLPPSNHRPLLALVSNIKVIRSVLLVSPSIEELRNNLKSELESYRIENLKSEVRSACCNLHAAITGLKQFASSGARSELLIDNAVLIERLNSIVARSSQTSRDTPK